MRARRGPIVLALLAALTWGGPGAERALADGDPASDVLLAQAVYYPYMPVVSAKLSRALDRLTAQAKAAGYPLKVAIIASPNDLGAVPQLFGKPQPYAKFLHSEIVYNNRQPLLVVMPAGFGWQDAGAAADATMAKVPRPAATDSNTLTRSAIVAVQKLAAANGHPLPAAEAGAGGPGRGAAPNPLIVFGGPLVLIALAVAVLTRRGRRRPAAVAGGSSPAGAGDSPGAGDPPPPTP